MKYLRKQKLNLSQELQRVQTNIHRSFSKSSQKTENHFGAWPVLLKQSLTKNSFSLKNKRILLTDLNGILRAELPGGQFTLGAKSF